MNVTYLTCTVGLALTLAAPTLAQSVSLPAEIQVPTDQQFLLSVAATGDQIYICQAKTDAPGQFAWKLKVRKPCSITIVARKWAITTAALAGS